MKKHILEGLFTAVDGMGPLWQSKYVSAEGVVERTRHFAVVPRFVILIRCFLVEMLRRRWLL